jgi:hypothetical protein
MLPDGERPPKKFCNGGEGFVPLLEHPWKEIEAVRHALAHEMLDLAAARGAQLADEIGGADAAGSAGSILATPGPFGG